MMQGFDEESGAMLRKRGQPQGQGPGQNAGGRATNGGGGFDYVFPEMNQDQFEPQIRAKPKSSACYRWFRRLLCLLVLVPAILFLLGLVIVTYYLKSPIDAQAYILPYPPALEGALSPDDRLTKAERILEGQIIGAESMAVSDGKLYTGTYDGKILELADDKISQEKYTLGQPPCGLFDYERTCGRPLGTRISPSGELYVADAYLGLYRMNLQDVKLERVLLGGYIVDGRPMKFLNDLDFLDENTIIFTDSSSTWDRRHFLNIIMEGKGDGRLLSFNLETKEISVLLDGLYFANGVQVSKDKSYVLVAETSVARIIKYHLSGDKKGQKEIFAENLPGLPDNIRLSSNGSLWVGFARVRFQGKFSMSDYLGPRPWLRTLLAKIFSYSQLFKLSSWFAPKYGLVLLMDMEGRYVSSLHDPTGQTIPSVSEVAESGNVLYLGSYYSPFIGKVKLDQEGQA